MPNIFMKRDRNREMGLGDLNITEAVGILLYFLDFINREDPNCEEEVIRASQIHNEASVYLAQMVAVLKENKKFNQKEENNG